MIWGLLYLEVTAHVGSLRIRSSIKVTTISALVLPDQPSNSIGYESGCKYPENKDTQRSLSIRSKPKGIDNAKAAKKYTHETDYLVFLAKESLHNLSTTALRTSMSRTIVRIVLSHFEFLSLQTIRVETTNWNSWRPKAMFAFSRLVVSGLQTPNVMNFVSVKIIPLIPSFCYLISSRILFKSSEALCF